MEEERPWDRVYRQQVSLAEREIAGEVILVPVRGKLAQLQQIFALNPVGAFIWRQLDGQRNLRGIHLGIIDRFEVTSAEAERDLFEYVGALREAKLIVEAGRDLEAPESSR